MKSINLLFLWATLAHAAPIELTIGNSVEIALRNATTVVKSENNLSYAGTQVLQSYAQFLPNLTATASYAYSSGTTLYTITGIAKVNESGRTATYALSSTLNLFNGLADYASFQSAIHRRSAAELTLLRAKQAVAIDVVQTYLQIVLDQKVLLIASRNYEASAGREQLLRAQTKVGSTTLADLYRQLAQTQSDRSALIAARSRARDDQYLLLRKLQLDLTQEYVFSEPPMERKASATLLRPEGELIERALLRRPDLQAGASTVEALRWDVNTARSAYFPRFDLGFNFTGSGTVLSRQFLNGMDQLPVPQAAMLSQLGDQNVGSVGLYLTWNVFDRFVTRLNVERSKVTMENSEVDYHDLKLQITQQIRQIYVDYKATLDQLDAATRGAQAATKAYQVIQGRYTVGASSFIDLLAAQAAAVQADVALEQAVLSNMLQSRQIDYYLGERIPGAGE